MKLKGFILLLLLPACGNIENSQDAGADGTLNDVQEAGEEKKDDANDAGCIVPPDAQCDAKVTGCSNTPSFSSPNDWACTCGASCDDYCKAKNGFKLPTCVSSPDAASFRCECHSA